MFYDVYEILIDGVVIEKIYQPTEPMYNSTDLLEIIRNRVQLQQNTTKEIVIKNIGQVENIGGEPPQI